VTTFDPNKPVQTRNGRKVKVFMTDAGGTHPILGAIKLDASMWGSARWAENGCYCCDGREHFYDLINVPEPVVSYQVVCARVGEGSVPYIGMPYTSIETARLDAKGLANRGHYPAFILKLTRTGPASAPSVSVERVELEGGVA